jgi:hypothetical protein
LLCAYEGIVRTGGDQDRPFSPVAFRFGSQVLQVLGMMILRSAMLAAAALTLSNCCLSSNGCNAPLAAATAPAPTGAPEPAWDGLGAVPGPDGDEAAPVQPRKPTRRRADAGVDAMSAQSSSGYRGNMSWEDEQASDRAEDARLKRKLIICRDCSGARQ